MAEILPKVKAFILWSTDRWDGPLRGLAHDGTRFLWFDNREIKEQDQFIFLLFELTPEELAEELKIHGEFIEQVGPHSTSGFEYRPVNPDYNLFFEKHPAKESIKRHRSYTQRKAVGYFEW